MHIEESNHKVKLNTVYEILQIVLHEQQDRTLYMIKLASVWMTERRGFFPYFYDFAFQSKNPKVIVLCQILGLYHIKSMLKQQKQLIPNCCPPAFYSNDS